MIGGMITYDLKSDVMTLHLNVPAKGTQLATVDLMPGIRADIADDGRLFRLHVEQANMQLKGRLRPSQMASSVATLRGLIVELEQLCSRISTGTRGLPSIHDADYDRDLWLHHQGRFTVAEEIKRIIEPIEVTQMKVGD